MTWPNELRDLVERRAGQRCEYCLIASADTGLPHEIDHIVSRKHGGRAEVDNLALACFLCNRYKGSDIASRHIVSGELVRLFHPRQDLWTVHFQIAGPVLDPLTEIGSVTAHLLRLNIASRVTERQLLQSIGQYPKIR